MTNFLIYMTLFYHVFYEENAITRYIKLMNGQKTNLIAKEDKNAKKIVIQEKQDFN